jgi:transcriptional regulator with XRE-family HTH domain
MSDKSIGEKIQQFRKALGLTQVEFAAEIGVEAPHLSNIERGIRGITIDRLIEMRRKYGISIDELFSTIECDEPLKQQWIGEIVEALQKMDPLQICLLKRQIAFSRESGPPNSSA